MLSKAKVQRSRWEKTFRASSVGRYRGFGFALGAVEFAESKMKRELERPWGYWSSALIIPFVD
jgi:hypothetical protein